MAQLYLVWGRTGEYTDYRDWVVCAYTTESQAMAHAVRAQARADALMREYGHWASIPFKANEWDERMDMDYTGTTYVVSAIELRT